MMMILRSGTLKSGNLRGWANRMDWLAISAYLGNNAAMFL